MIKNIPLMIKSEVFGNSVSYKDVCYQIIYRIMNMNLRWKYLLKIDDNSSYRSSIRDVKYPKIWDVVDGTNQPVLHWTNVRNMVTDDKPGDWTFALESRSWDLTTCLSNTIIIHRVRKQLLLVSAMPKLWRNSPPPPQLSIHPQFVATLKKIIKTHLFQEIVPL